ncbi:MAG TPA: MerR family transcriptional regulator [Polyangiaceae bacterium]
MRILFFFETIPFVIDAIRFASLTIRLVSLGIRLSKLTIRFPKLTIRIVIDGIRFTTMAIRLASVTVRFSSRMKAFSRLPIRLFCGYNRFMDYTMADLEQATGLTARTIRKYMADGLLEPPERKGLAAVYPESTLVKAMCIVRMRAQAETWETVGARLRNWPMKRLREYLASTEPAPPQAPVAPPPAPTPATATDGAPASTPALEGEPVTPLPRLPPTGAAPREELESHASADDEWLPDGPRWLPVPLLPGLALWVREDAAPVVRRTAAEIVRRYGSP